MSALKLQSLLEVKKNYSNHFLLESCNPPCPPPSTISLYLFIN